jgi:hypothetical protein
MFVSIVPFGPGVLGKTLRHILHINMLFPMFTAE